MPIEEFKKDGVEYYVDTNTGAISYMKVMSKDAQIINIPSVTQKGRTITSFGSSSHVLSSCLAENVEIRLPDTITYIGKSAFYYDKFVTKLIMPNNVTIIGEAAFEFSRIKEVVWPEMCRVIPPLCFRGSKLNKFIGGRRLDTIKEGAFSHCYLSVADFSRCQLTEIPFDALLDAFYVRKIIPPYYSECSEDTALYYGYNIEKDGTLTNEDTPAS